MHQHTDTAAEHSCHKKSRQEIPFFPENSGRQGHEENGEPGSLPQLPGFLCHGKRCFQHFHKGMGRIPYPMRLKAIGEVIAVREPIAGQVQNRHHARDKNNQ